MQQEGQLRVSQDATGEGWLSDHGPRGTHKSCRFPEARSSNGSQVRAPPAARQLDAVKQWPPKVLKVGVCGSLHPGSNLWLMPALSLCLSVYLPFLCSPPPSLSISLLPFSPFDSPSPSLPSPPPPLLSSLSLYVQRNEAQEPKREAGLGRHSSRQRGFFSTWLMYIRPFETQGVLPEGAPEMARLVPVFHFHPTVAILASGRLSGRLRGPPLPGLSQTCHFCCCYRPSTPFSDPSPKLPARAHFLE